jgi:hypothetical protein
VAEAHGRTVGGPLSGIRLSRDDDEQHALLVGEESTGDGLLPSLLTRMERLEDRLQALDLPEHTNLATLIEREVQRQLEQALPALRAHVAKPRVAKVSMQQQTEERDAATNSTG